MGYRGVVLVKPASETEFRSAITFEESGIIHIFPGKVSDIFHVAREAEALIQNNPDSIKQEGEFRYVKDGVLDKGKEELALPLSGDRNTSGLQTHDELRATPTTPITSCAHTATFRPANEKEGSSEPLKLLASN